MFLSPIIILDLHLENITHPAYYL